MTLIGVEVFILEKDGERQGGGGDVPLAAPAVLSQLEPFIFLGLKFCVAHAAGLESGLNTSFATSASILASFFVSVP